MFRICLVAFCLVISLQTSLALKCHFCEPNPNSLCENGPSGDALECTPENSNPTPTIPRYIKGMIPSSLKNNNLLNITTKGSPKPITFTKQIKTPIPEYLCYKVWGEIDAGGNIEKGSAGIHGCISRESLGAVDGDELPSIDFCANGDIDDHDGDFKAKGSICVCKDDGCNGGNSMVAATGLIAFVSIYHLWSK